LADVSKMAKRAGMVFRKSGNPVPKATVQKILHNRIYTGDFDFGGKTYRGRYEPIISHELWQQVQQVFQGRRRQKQRHDFAFSGLITCGHCGCSLVGELKKGRYVYYHCTGNKGKCLEPYVREEVLEAEFTKAIRALAFTPAFLQEARAAVEKAHGKQDWERRQTIVRLQAEHAKLERRIEKMYEDKLDGMIDEAFFKRKSDECRTEQARLAAEIKRLQKARIGHIDNLAQLAQQAGDLFKQQPAHEKRKLLRYVVTECTWAKGLLEYRLKPGFEEAREDKLAA